MQIQIFICGFMDQRKSYNCLMPETCIFPASLSTWGFLCAALLTCKYNLMALANRKQLPAAVSIFAAVLLVQKCTEKIMLINFLFPINSYMQYIIYLAIKSRFCSKLFKKKLFANWSNVGTELLYQKCSWPTEELGDQCKGHFCWIARENSIEIEWGSRRCNTPPPPRSTPSNTHYA